MEYRFTESGVISKMYSHQKERNVLRGHGNIGYSKEELTQWLYKNGYEDMYENYALSNFDKNLKPSVDRIDDNIGYEIDNIQLVTYRENIQDCYEKRLNGSNSHGGGSQYNVIQKTLDGDFINEFHSIADAERETGVPKTNIGQVCNNKRRTAGGFIWERVDR